MRRSLALIAALLVASAAPPPVVLVEQRRRRARCPNCKGDVQLHDVTDWCPSCKTGVSPEFV